MNNDTKKCPYCGGEVKDIAIKCKHCGKFFEDKENSESNSDNIYVANNVLLILKKTFFIIVYAFCVFIWLLLILGIIGAMLPDDESSVDNSSQFVQHEQRQKELKNFEKEVKKQRKILARQKQEEEKEMSKYFSNNQQQNEEQKIQNEQQVYQKDLEVIETYMCYEGYYKAVCGVVKNNTNKKKIWVSIDIDLFDNEGNILGQISDSIDELGPNQTWKFRALLDTYNAARYKVKDVSSLSWW